VSQALNLQPSPAAGAETGVEAGIESGIDSGPEAAAAEAVAPARLQVRSRSFTAVVLKVSGAPDTAFFEALDALMRQAPQFFVNAPLVLDLASAAELDDKAAFVKLVRALRARRLSPVGIQNGSPDQGVAAFGAGLVTLQGGRDAPPPERSRRGADTAALPEPGPAPAATDPVPEPVDLAPAALLVTEPVRSGQRIFADRGDLVVLASVSPGAELIAHGNIHVYGPLRGRALAGVNGDRSARIFATSLEAELIAIAGLYRTSEDLGTGPGRQRVQAFLKDDALVVEPLK